MSGVPCPRCGLIHAPEGPCAAAPTTPSPAQPRMPETQDVAQARPRTMPMGQPTNETTEPNLPPPVVLTDLGLGKPPFASPPTQERPPEVLPELNIGKPYVPPFGSPPTQERPLNETMAAPVSAPPLIVPQPAPPPGRAPTPVPAAAPAPDLNFAPPTPPEALLGGMVGSFKLVRLLGKGGMGAVFLGEHPSIGSKVAIKMLHPMLATRPELVKRFYDEARAVNLIGHEHIVSIFDLNQLPPNRYYIVMEYLEGQTLAALLKENGEKGLSLDATTDLLMQLCDALGAAHAREIIHRDLKPENIFITRRGNRDNFVKLVDFGIAKLRDEQGMGNETATGVLVGTPEYMSPEQADNLPVDARSDLYALGVIAYRLVAGRLPFPETSLGRLIAAHLEKEPPPPRKYNPDLPVPYEAAILRALAKKPVDRFQTAAEFAKAIDEARQAPASPPRAQTSQTMPGAVPPPQTGAPRVVADFEVELLLPQPSRKLRAADISRGGLFLCTETGFPPLFSRVKLGVPFGNGKMEVAGEVVRHVSASEAKAWGMAPGFGVQFVDLTPEERAALADLTARRPAAAPGPVPPPASPPPPRDVQELLGYLSERFNGSHYDLLAVPLDADVKQIGPAAYALEQKLRKAMERAGPEHQAPLKVGVERVKSAMETLGNAVKRITYDAHRGNYRGVAKCLEAGFPAQDLASLHQQFLSERPGLDARSQQQLGRIKLARNRGNLPAALREIEQALLQDPLNYELQRGWAEIRKLSETPKPPTPA